MRRDIVHLLRDSSAALVTTLIDYYGLPADFPGMSTLPDGSSYQKVEHLEQALTQDIANNRFLPYLMIHEFEAFLFAQPHVIMQTFAQRGSIERVFGDLSSFASPEEIHDGQQSHPAARIQ